MNKIAANRPKASQEASPEAVDNIFPASLSAPEPSPGARLWSSIDREMTMTLSLTEADDAPFLTADFARLDADAVRIRMRSNVDGSMGEESTTFYVPIELVQYLGAYFTRMVERAERAGILRGTEVYRDTITGPLSEIAK